MPFSSKFKFDGKYLALVMISLQTLTHAMAAHLSFHVQIFVDFSLTEFGWELNDLSSLLNYDGKIASGMGSKFFVFER